MWDTLLKLAVVSCMCLIATGQGSTFIYYNTPKNDNAKHANMYVALGGDYTLKCNQTECHQPKWYRTITDKQGNPVEEMIDESDAELGYLSTTASYEFMDKNKPCTYVSTLTRTGATMDDRKISCKPQNSDRPKDAVGFIMSIHVYEITGIDMQMQVGQEAVLKCDVSLQKTVTFDWYHNGAKVTLDDNYVRSDVNNSLTIKHTAHNDAGEYVCNSTLENQQLLSATVNLNASPFVGKFDGSKNLVQGDPLILHCNAWGHPPPSVTWQKRKEDEEVHEDVVIDEAYIAADKLKASIAADKAPRITLTDYSTAGPVIKNGTLRIEALDYDDRSMYTCIATDGFTSANATVLVRVKDKLAALWPFLGICVEVLILCIIIFFYEHHRAKKLAEEEPAEETGHLTNSADHKGKDDVRHRK